MLKGFFQKLYWLIDKENSLSITIVLLVIALFIGAVFRSSEAVSFLWFIRGLYSVVILMGALAGVVWYVATNLFNIKVEAVFIAALLGPGTFVFFVTGISVFVTSVMWFLIIFGWQGLVTIGGALLILFFLFPRVYEKRMGWVD